MKEPSDPAHRWLLLLSVLVLLQIYSEEALTCTGTALLLHFHLPAFKQF